MAITLTDEDRQLLKAVNRNIPEEIAWLYHEVVAIRSNITEEMISEREKEISKRGICHVKDSVEVLGWKKGEADDKRKRICKLCNSFVVSRGEDSATVNQLIFDLVKKFYRNDYKNPEDALLSKKEQRIVRKRRKREASEAEMAEKQAKKERRASSSNDEKTAKRKWRAEVRKKAKELGISAEELRDKIRKGEFKL